jgi:hypothetical protein
MRRFGPTSAVLIGPGAQFLWRRGAATVTSECFGHAAVRAALRPFVNP